MVKKKLASRNLKKNFLGQAHKLSQFTLVVVYPQFVQNWHSISQHSKIYYLCILNCFLAFRVMPEKVADIWEGFVVCITSGHNYTVRYMALFMTELHTLF